MMARQNGHHGIVAQDNSAKVTAEIGLEPARKTNVDAALAERFPLLRRCHLVQRQLHIGELFPELLNLGRKPGAHAAGKEADAQSALFAAVDATRHAYRSVRGFKDPPAFLEKCRSRRGQRGPFG